MPTELEELVGFLHHGNTTIRQTAVENLLGYSKSRPSIFKTNQLEPVKDLKLLPIAKNVLTILINISEDKEVLKALATDDAFLETLLLRITPVSPTPPRPLEQPRTHSANQSQKEPNADEITMLLANLAKADEIQRILDLKRAVPKPLSTSELAIDQLLDCFVKGADGSYNKHANYDYLSYFFADLAKHTSSQTQFPACRSYFTRPAAHDASIIPLSKLLPFTEHASAIRRRGVASTLKNCAFNVPAHPALLAPAAASGANALPYLLLPLAGPESYTDEETEAMLEDLQLLPPDKAREPDVEIAKTLLETLLLLATTREGREALRGAGAYFVVRECHLHVEDEGVREVCDRFVQLVMRDEAEDGDGAEGGRVTEVTEEEEDEDEQIVEVL